MDLLLLLLIALPFAAAAVIVGISSVRRRRHASSAPAHRFQSDTAAVQDEGVYPAAAPRAVQPGRERRAASAEGRAHG